MLKVGFLALVSLPHWTGAVLASTSETRTAREPRFEKLRGSDELRDPRIVDIVEDHDGFLWLATMSGLVRYDGYEYRWFVSDPDDPHSLGDSRLRYLLVDDTGALWVGTWTAGLNRYDPQTGQFARYRHDPSDPHSLSDDVMAGLFGDREGNLWVGTHNGLNRLDRESGRFERYLYTAPSASDSAGPDPVDPIYALVQDPRGTLWIGEYGGGLRKFENGATIARYRNVPGDPASLSDDRIMSLALDGSATLWIATWGGGLDAFDLETESFEHYRHDPADASSLPGDEIFNVFVDGRDDLWVMALSGGLARLDRESGRFTRYPHDPGRVGSPSEVLPGPAFENAEGSLFLVTWGQGVDVWHPEKPVLSHYRAHGGPNALSDNFVIAVLQDAGGDVWVGTYSGLDRFDLASGSFTTTYRHDPKDPNSLAGSMVYALHEDDDGILWVGTWGGGLNRLDPRTGRITRYPCDANDRDDPSSLSGCDPKVIYGDSSGNIWVGTYDGLSRFDRNSGRFQRYAHDPRDPSSLSDQTVNDVREDANGELWVSTDNGLNRWQPDSDSFVRYQFDPSSPRGLVHRMIRVVYPASDGSLWVGTSGGLQRMSRNDAGSARFVLYGERHGLPRLSVTGILEDDEGNLWIQTRGDGLWWFDPETLATGQLDASDGIPKGAFDEPGWKMRDGRILLGGVDGFVILDPATVSTNAHVPPIAITGIEIDNRPLSDATDSGSRTSVVATRSLALSPQNRILSFTFTALDFQAPEKNRYRHQLEGFEDDWAETDASNRRATYTNLAPGEYVFRVTGSNNHGVWNEEGTSVAVTVLPAWWQTTWFRLATVVSSLAVLFGLHRLRIKYIVEANRRLASQIERRRRVESNLLRSQGELRSLSGRLVVTQEEERRRVARELHDGVAQQLALLSMRLGVLAKRPPEDRLEASRQFEELKTSALGLSRDVRDVSHRLHSSELEHLGLVQALRTECSRIERESGMKIELDTDEAPDSSSLDAALCLYRVAQESLANAIKHSGASRIRVRLAAVVGGMELLVSDDGAGFDVQAAKLGGGLGFTSMKERVRHLGGRFDVDSHPEEGTEVRAWVPQ